MGSQPIRIQLGKSCRKILWENLAGNSRGKFLQENLVGHRGGEKSQFKKGSDWWKYSNWNRVMGSQPIRIQLRKMLQENLVGQGGGEKANLRKAVIGENLAFGIGLWGANQSGSSSEKSKHITLPQLHCWR